MLLTISTTHPPATDLGYLLGKHPERTQSFDLPVGQAHVFFPEVSAARCTAALLLDIDPVGLCRRPRHEDFVLSQYTNDRPYVASSLMSVAIARVLGARPRPVEQHDGIGSGHALDRGRRVVAVDDPTLPRCDLANFLNQIIIRCRAPVFFPVHPVHLVKRQVEHRSQLAAEGRLTTARRSNDVDSLELNELFEIHAYLPRCTSNRSPESAAARAITWVLKSIQIDPSCPTAIIPP